MKTGGVLENLKETLIAKLSVSKPGPRTDYLIERINDVIKPPRSVSADNVNIRVMYIVNDRVNSHGGRFRRADLLRLSQLILDTPVLIGHNRANAPVARNFHAELEEKSGDLWLKSYFYWPRVPDDQTDSFQEKIDSGVLKECSISFTYDIPECSECGQDIRNCPHEINANKSTKGSSNCHFIYGGISQVLETSLVYRGSVSGTYLSGKLSIRPSDEIVIRTGDREMTMSCDDSTDRNGQIGIVNLDGDVRGPVEITSKPSNIGISVASWKGRCFLLVNHV
jgi:hypothetical protein